MAVFHTFEDLEDLVRADLPRVFTPGSTPRLWIVTPTSVGWATLRIRSLAIEDILRPLEEQRAIFFALAVWTHYGTHQYPVIDMLSMNRHETFLAHRTHLEPYLGTSALSAQAVLKCRKIFKSNALYEVV